jgi:hypothetical protein
MRYETVISVKIKILIFRIITLFNFLGGYNIS